MSYRITFITALFQGNEDRQLSHTVLQAMLDCLCACDCAYLRANPSTPRIYASGVSGKPKIHYDQEPLGQEDWKDIPTILKDEQGDCEDLACWRAAELIVREGIKARPIFNFKIMASGSYLYHIIVSYPDGTTEDPSRKLGMGKELFG